LRCAAAGSSSNGNSSSSSVNDEQQQQQRSPPSSRRAAMLAGAGATLAAAAALAPPPKPAAAEIAELEPMDALKEKDYGKPRMKYGDFERTPTGLQYLDIKPGDGAAPEKGQTVVVDWSGYTIGYYGRPFEARNKPKGSSFTGENKDFYRFQLGSGAVIPGFEEAVAGMRVGGIRRVVVPVELGYPDGNFKRVGPRPSTFAGERALDFVLSNRGMIDKTLLFDIELLRIQ
jgi:FKBP-type peptidyl-prolyl cis-trans isomerase